MHRHGCVVATGVPRLEQLSSREQKFTSAALSTFMYTNASVVAFAAASPSCAPTAAFSRQ